MSAPSSKHEVLCLLEQQIELGRGMLARPIHDRGDLIEVDQERSAWAMHGKRLIGQLLGDSAGLARFDSARTGAGADVSARLTLEQEREHFRHAMQEQIAHLEKLHVLLQRLDQGAAI